MKNKTLGLLGLAQSANKLSIGSDLTLELIKSNKVFLVLLDKDIKGTTEKQLTNICDLNKIALMRTFNSCELSQAIGKRNVKVIGVLDKGFAEHIYLNH